WSSLTSAGPYPGLGWRDRPSKGLRASRGAEPADRNPSQPQRRRQASSAHVRLPSVRDLFGPEKDVLRPIEVGVVELANQLLACRGRHVPLVLLDVADLDPLDVAPARRLGAGDRPFDAMRAVARDAGQRPRHSVVVLDQPLLVVLALDARLERRDHVPNRHVSVLPKSEGPRRPPPSLPQGIGCAGEAGARRGTLDAITPLSRFAV